MSDCANPSDEHPAKASSWKRGGSAWPSSAATTA